MLLVLDCDVIRPHGIIEHRILLGLQLLVEHVLNGTLVMTLITLQELVDYLLFFLLRQATAGMLCIRLYRDHTTQFFRNLLGRCVLRLFGYLPTDLVDVVHGDDHALPLPAVLDHTAIAVVVVF